MDEFQLMKNEPKQLFDIYMNMLMNGEVLSDEQVVKFEYLKKLFIKDDNGGI